MGVYCVVGAFGYNYYLGPFICNKKTPSTNIICIGV